MKVSVLGAGPLTAPLTQLLTLAGSEVRAVAPGAPDEARAAALDHAELIFLTVPGPQLAATTSPTPARPTKVSGLAPTALPRRRSSASPRLNKRPRTPAPMPMASDMPMAAVSARAADALSSTPRRSSLVYTRQRGLCRAAWARARTS